jgi:acyl carrier protein
MSEEAIESTVTAAAEAEMIELLLEALNLEQLQAGEVDPDAAMFGQQAGGWGLDSIDALEIALVIQEKYGVELRSEDPEMRQAFASVRSLTAYVVARRTS